MQDFAKTFYKSKAWKNCRESYMRQVGGLCEECLAKGQYNPGEIVHHKIHLNPENINNSEIALSFDNLQLLCRNCHAQQHTKNKKRFRVDDLGKVFAFD